MATTTAGFLALCFALAAGIASRAVGAVSRALDTWRTWQAASPDQRAQWKRTRRLDGRRFDCAPDQMGSK